MKTNEINFFNEDWYWSSAASDIWDHGYIPASCHCSPQKWTQVLHTCVVSLTREKEREKKEEKQIENKGFFHFLKKELPQKKNALGPGPRVVVPGLSHTRCGRFTSPVYRGRTVTVSYHARTVTVYLCDTEGGLTVLSLWPSHAPHVTINFFPPTFSFSFFLFFLNYSNNSAPPQPKKSHFMNGVTSR